MHPLLGSGEACGAKVQNSSCFHSHLLTNPGLLLVMQYQPSQQQIMIYSTIKSIKANAVLQLSVHHDYAIIITFLATEFTLHPQK